MKHLKELILLALLLFLTACSAGIPNVGAQGYVETSAQTCDPTSQSDVDGRNLWNHPGPDRYTAWLQCNPPQIDQSHIPGGCSMSATNTWNKDWLDPQAGTTRHAWLANQSRSWQTNPDYWWTTTSFAAGGQNRLPYNYPDGVGQSWDIPPVDATTDSSQAMERLQQIGKVKGAQLLLCQQQGRYSFKVLYWLSIHDPKQNPIQIDYWATVPLTPLAWGHMLYRTWYATMVLPSLRTGRVGGDAGTQYYCVTVDQWRDTCPEPPTEMTVYDLKVIFAQSIHGCSVSSQGLNA